MVTLAKTPRAVTVLMKRDGLDRADATTIVREAMDEINELFANGDTWMVEETWYEYTGLEPDYLLDLIG